MFQPVIEFESISSHLLKWKPRLLIGGRGANPVISESFFIIARGAGVLPRFFEETPNKKQSRVPDSEIKLT